MKVSQMTRLLNSKVISTIALALGALCVSPTASASPAGACQQKPIFDASQSGLKGTVTLCKDAGGIAASISAKGLKPGNAYTSWFIYFDNPAACTTPYQCFTPDLLGPDPLNPVGVIGRMDSGIAGSTGNALFLGKVSGFKPSAGSQVHVVIFNHGAAMIGDGKALARQLLTPEMSPLGAPGMGVGVPKAGPAGGIFFTM
jgi:hypothetical protein